MIKLKGYVRKSNQGKSLVESDNKFYIVRGDFPPEDEIEFDEETSLPMPSFAFGLACLIEDDLDKTLDFIQNKWFKN